MTFRELKQNYPVYMLDRRELRVSQGKATSVAFPRADLATTKMVVDVTIEADGKSATYAIPDTASLTYAGDIVLSTDREGLAREVEAMRASAEQALASVDRQREIAEKSKSLLAELSPSYREKAETEERFGKIESSVSDIRSMLDKFISEFKGCDSGRQ